MDGLLSFFGFIVDVVCGLSDLIGSRCAGVRRVSIPMKYSLVTKVFLDAFFGLICGIFLSGMHAPFLSVVFGGAALYAVLLGVFNVWRSSFTVMNILWLTIRAVFFSAGISLLLVAHS